jgi:hypothetical protein
LTSTSFILHLDSTRVVSLERGQVAGFKVTPRTKRGKQVAPPSSRSNGDSMVPYPAPN